MMPSPQEPSNAEALIQFRKLPPETPISSIQIPAPIKERKMTDVAFIFTYIFFILTLIGCAVYASFDSDTRRVNLYDDCGNLCGYDNQKVEGVSCTGVDMSDRPYLGEYKEIDNETKVTFDRRVCVENCDDDTEIASSELHRCQKKSKGIDHDFKRLLVLMVKNIWRYFFVILITLLINVIFLLMFRFALLIFIYLPFVIFLGIFGASAVYFFMMNQIISGVLSILFFIIVAITFFVVFFQLHLVKLIFKEAAKAVYSAPLILLCNVIVSLLGLVVSAATIYVMFIISTAATLQKVGIVNDVDLYEWKPTLVSILTLFLLLLKLLWTFEILDAFGIMFVAGTVSSWYFSKDKTRMNIAVIKSIYVCLRFHIGTAIFGALIIAIIRMLRMLTQKLMESRNMFLRFCVECLCSCLENIIRYFTTQAYIMTMIHGRGLWKSGKRAASIISENLNAAMSTFCLGKFVVYTNAMAVWAITGLISMFIFWDFYNDIYVFSFAIVLCILIAAELTIYIFNVYLLAIESIILCYFEDLKVNDGASRPYAMSQDLKDFVEKSNSARPFSVTNMFRRDQ